VQGGARARVDHSQPGDHHPGGQPFLVGGIDLPDLMRVLGPVAGLGLSPTGRGRGQAVPAEPALECAVGGDLDRGVRASQFDPHADGPPAGMLAAESQGRLQERGGRAGVTTAGAVVGGQIHERPIT
jgi:hypothetical protein